MPSVRSQLVRDVGKRPLPTILKRRSGSLVVGAFVTCPPAEPPKFTHQPPPSTPFTVKRRLASVPGVGGTTRICASGGVDDDPLMVALSRKLLRAPTRISTSLTGPLIPFESLYEYPVTGLPSARHPAPPATYAPAGSRKR